MISHQYQGANARSNGNVLEATIKNVLEQHGFNVVPYALWEKNSVEFPSELLLLGAEYTTIYGYKRNTGLLLKSALYGLNTRIVYRWQQTSGTTDEKLPCLYLDCVEAIPENDIIIILDGQGFRSGALEWFKSANGERKYNNQKNMYVLSLSEFVEWANIFFNSGEKQGSMKVLDKMQPGCC